MSKTQKNPKSDYFKQILDQIAGEPDKNIPLIPEYTIKGTGDIWCYDPVDRKFRKKSRGSRIFILKENYDHKDRTLVYTYDNLTVCIDPEDIEYVGFD